MSVTSLEPICDQDSVMEFGFYQFDAHWVTGHFGPKTLRHQDISALVSGHFGTTAECR